MADSFSLSDVFISYSRRDSDFVRRLDSRLRASGQAVWVDWEDIPLSADWWKEIQAGIDGANTFMFIISPDSVTSEVCYNEVEHAVKAGKRFIPILHREITDPDQQQKMHPAIGSHNWIFFEQEAQFEADVQRLVDALQTDLSYVRAHTRLLVQAQEWDNRGHDTSFLLNGTAVHEAESWLAGAGNAKPGPTPLQAEYIVASRQAQSRRQRNILAGVSVALIVALALAVLSFVLFRQSEANEVIALTQARIAADNEAEALARGTAVANQAATSEFNANVAATNESRANRNADLAATNEARAAANEAEAIAQAATADANANIAATNEARANRNADLAATNEARAETNAERAEAARLRAQAIALASRAEVALENEQIEFARLLGIEALAHYPYTWQAERVLTLAMQPRFRWVSSVDAPDRDPLVAPDGTRRIVISADRPQQAAIVDVASDEILWTLIGHTDTINGAVWSPNGNFVATFSQDNTIRIWQADGGTSYRTLFGHTAPVTAAGWSPDSTRLATAGQDRTLRLWDVETGVLPVVLPHHRDDMAWIVFSDDRARIDMIASTGATFRWSLWASTDALIDGARAGTDRTFTDEETALVGLPLVRSAPRPNEIAGCEGALPSQLYPGVRARVSSKNNLLPLRVRENPSIASGESNIAGRVAPDQTFQVLDGPVCRDGFAWFEVIYGLEAQRGWVAEGAMTDDGPDYFAEPIPGR